MISLEQNRRVRRSQDRQLACSLSEGREHHSLRLLGSVRAGARSHDGHSRHRALELHHESGAVVDDIRWRPVRTQREVSSLAVSSEGCHQKATIPGDDGSRSAVQQPRRSERLYSVLI